MGNSSETSETAPLGKRYLYKLSGNIIGFFINMITYAIIPRGLGPNGYGDFNFLTNFFTQVVNFLDMGTSTCFYTKLSQRPKEQKLAVFYFYLAGFMLCGIIAFVGISTVVSIDSELWPGQEIQYICMAAGLCFIIWIVQVLNQMSDAYGLTVYSEFMRILQKVIGLILILLLYFFHMLNLSNFFYYNYILLFFLGSAFILMIERRGFSVQHNWRISNEQLRNYSAEFYEYSRPLFIYVVIGVAVNIFDRWLLQIYGGSSQQGFYSLAYQIGTICFLFTSALTPLLLREFSISYMKRDITQMRFLFRRYVPLLCSVAIYFSAFIVVQAHNVIYIMGGTNFSDAVRPVAIMAFYPIYQTYGQLSSTVFYATGQTSLYSNIGIIFLLIGIPVTYFLIAPGDKLGLNLGSSGLAVKMVLLQFIGVNVQLYFNSRYLKFSFLKYLGHQILNIGCMILLAAIATFFVNSVSEFSKNVVISFTLSGFLYTLMVACLVYYFPVVFGLKGEDVRSAYEYLRDKIR